MNLTKALKQKKKLIKKANDYYSRFLASNSFEKDTTPAYNPEEMFNSWVETTNELVTLKTKIQIANQPIANKIFELGELKNLVASFKRIVTQKGAVRDRYNGESVEYLCYFDQVQKDEQITKWEEQIETLQEEIEAFNALTKI